jgi:hypothetical protein
MMRGTISRQELGQLRQAMFLGLARQPLAVPEQLQALTARVSGREPALMVLALVGQRQRFERPVVEPGACTIPDAARRMHEAQRTLIPEVARRLLLRLAKGIDKGQAGAVVRTAVRRVMRAGFRLHPFDLPKLIDQIKGDARCFGLAERAYLSLADPTGKPDAPSLLHADVTIENWTEFPRAHRVAFLRQQRRRDPVAARVLLESVFKSEPAAVRGELLAALDAGLSAADLPFLESLSADRSESVRNVALRLSGSVPGTPAFAARLAAAARCFVRNASGGNALLRRAGLTRSADTVFTPPKKATRSEQRSALASMFDGLSLADIAAAASLGVEEIVASLPADEDTVLHALSNQALRDGDETTMVRLIAQRIANIDAQKSSIAPMLAWLAENLAGPAPVEFGNTLLGSTAWQAVLENLRQATTPATMKHDGTLIWSAAVLPSQLLARFQDAMAALSPAITRPAHDFAELVLALDAVLPPQR